MAAPQPRAAQAAPTASSSASSLLREVAEVVVLAIILYFGISFAVQAVHVEGLSMYATLVVTVVSQRTQYIRGELGEINECVCHTVERDGCTMSISISLNTMSIFVRPRDAQ